MIVLDASAALAALLNDGTARRLLSDEQAHAPQFIDLEVANVLRRHRSAKRLTDEQATSALHGWLLLGLVRHEHTAVLPRVWQLRDNLTAYDAAYVALAEALGAPLVTLDARLAQAPGITCAVSILPD